MEQKQKAKNNNMPIMQEDKLKKQKTRRMAYDTLAAALPRQIRIPSVTLFTEAAVTVQTIRVIAGGILLTHEVISGFIAALVPYRPVQNQRHPLLKCVPKVCCGEVEGVVCYDKGIAAWVEVTDISIIVVTFDGDVIALHVRGEASLAASDA